MNRTNEVVYRSPKWLTFHALSRLRERWPLPPDTEARDCCKLLLDQLYRSMVAGDCYVTPGGLYVPFILFGLAGCAVVKRDRNVVTLEEHDKCPNIAHMRTSGRRAA